MSGSEKEKGRWYNIQIESSKGPAVPGNNLRMKEYKFGYFDTFFLKPLCDFTFPPPTPLLVRKTD